MKRNGVTDTACHARIYGRVQGVGFRYSARTAAHKLGITGWVRNVSDGSVEVVCEGEANAVKRYIIWLGKGPPGSHVSRVDTSEIPYRGSFRSFTVEF